MPDRLVATPPYFVPPTSVEPALLPALTQGA
jgi:hypothetical protein